MADDNKYMKVVKKVFLLSDLSPGGLVTITIEGPRPWTEHHKSAISIDLGDESYSSMYLANLRQALSALFKHEERKMKEEE